MRRIAQYHRALILATIFSLLMAVALSACGPGATAKTPENASNAPTASSGASATASSGSTTTPTTSSAGPVTACSQVAGFGSAGSVSVSSAFSEVAPPAGTVGVLAQTFETNSVQFELINACTKETTTAQIRTYFATGLAQHGFTQSNTFPYHGNSASACGDPYCWISHIPADRYISLESVVAHGAVVTYTLRLAIAPMSGDETINGTYYGRFDASGTANDVWWEIVTSPPRQAKLVPVGAAKIVNVGVTSFSNVTLSHLVGLSYGATALNGNASGGVLVAGDVFALIGNNGHYVKVEVTSVGSSAPFTLALTYVVYRLTF